jgi:hypothetical protein
MYLLDVILNDELGHITLSDNNTNGTDEILEIFNSTPTDDNDAWMYRMREVCVAFFDFICRNKAAV